MRPKAPTAARAARAGAVGFTLLALALTALTAFLLSRVFGEGKYATEPLADVVVAAREIPAAQPIREDDIKVVQWPRSTIPDGAITSRDDLLGPKVRVPVITLLPGEAIVRQRLASAEAGTGMASRVAKDKRGFPIRVEQWIADARLVYPGAVVDVIATIADPVERAPVTLTVLQRLTVLAVNGRIDASGQADPKDPTNQSGGNGAVVTVLVSPGEAEILALAAREGKLDLTLRNANDTESVQTQGANTFALLGRPFPGTTTAQAGQPIMAAAPVPSGQRRPSPSLADIRRAAAREPGATPETVVNPEPQGGGSVRTIRIGGK